MMNERHLREQICEMGRRLYNKGFAAANDGNISIRLNAREILCSPTGVSKGFMKPEDMCVVDYEGKQLRGVKKRTSEILMHLAVYKTRPDVGACVHCHPPHATAFAIAHEPIPKCILPEVEVFLGEVPIARYETPGTQKFADTVIPYVKDCNTIILANHGTLAFADTVEKAYFNTEIVDAYCRMLILARQLGRVNYFTEQQTQELMEFKKRLGIDDPRLRLENCDLCSNSHFREGYSEFVPQAKAFVQPTSASANGRSPRGVEPSANGKHGGAGHDVEALVQTITDQVLAALQRAE
jgi:L-fuculose-phosphate aldolase